MTRADRDRIAAERAERQGLGARRFARPEDVVRWFGAMQAQDYLGCLWAVGLRTRAATERDVERALDDGRIVRTHGFRGTWQLVAPEDVRPMLALVGDGVRVAAARRHRQLGIDARMVRRSQDVFARVLAGGTHLTRAELAGALQRARIDATGPRLMHLLGRAELDGLICNGRRRGKPSTYALLDERVASQPPAAGDELRAALARRYVQSRAPATAHDLAWWTGWSLATARQALARAGIDAAATARRRRPAPGAHLLPGFDEYLVGYRDRDAQLDPTYVRAINAGGGMLSPAVLVGGQVVGTWRRALAAREVAITVDLFAPLGRTARAAIAAAADRYAAFTGRRSRRIFNNATGA